jgi:hypothetical protein
MQLKTIKSKPNDCGTAPGNLVELKYHKKLKWHTLALSIIIFTFNFKMLTLTLGWQGVWQLLRTIPQQISFLIETFPLPFMD